jgi:MFS family permease
MQSYWQAVRSFNRGIWMYFSAWAMLAVAYLGFVGVLQNLYLVRLNFSIETIGAIMGAGQLVWAVAALPSAALGRRFGLKRAVMLGIAINCVAYAMFYSVEALPESMWTPWLIFWNTVNWTGSAVLVVNSTPYLAGLVQPGERSHAFAVQSAFFPLFGFVGSMIAGQLPALFAAQLGVSLSDPAPYRLSLWFVPAIYVVMLLIMSRVQPVHLQAATHRDHAPSAKAPIATLLIFGLIGFLQSIGDGVIITFFSIYLDRGLGLAPAQIGALVGTASLLPVLAALLSAPLMQRIGAGATFATSAVGLGAAMGALAVLPSVLTATLSRMVAGAMLSVGGASRNVFSQELVETRWRALSSAVSTIGLALGWAAAAFIGGYLIRTAGFGAMFLFAGGAAWCSAALAFVYLRRRKARKPQPFEPAPVLQDSPAR